MKWRWIHLLLFLLLFASNGKGQLLGSEWIESGADYLKLLVAEEGIYRVYASDLAPYISSPINPNNFKLFYRGKQQRIYVYDKTNPGVFDADDYIEFYGKPNDGMDEREMYRDPISGALDPDEQPDSLYSVFSDTSVYFLTWNVSGPPLRYLDFVDFNFASYPTLNYYKEYNHIGYHNRFFPGVGSLNDGIEYVKNPHWITAEGYIGNTFTTPQTLTLPVSGKASSSGSVVVRVRLTSLAFGNYSCTVSLPQFGLSKTITTSFRPYLKTITFVIPSASVTTSQIQITVTPNNNTPHALCWISVEYDHNFDMSGSKSKVLRVPNVYNAKSVIQLTNIGVISGDTIWAYDLTSGYRIYGQQNGSQFTFTLPKYSGTDSIVFTTESAVKTPLIKLANIQNYGDPQAGAEFVIITHPLLLPSAEAYKTYRDTNSVNRFSAKVYDVTAIYDEFGYGVPTPLAIQRFIRAALSRWIIKPKYIFLWGKGHYLIRDNPENLVPTWGQPASDILFASNWDSPDTLNPVPKLPIGRINVTSNEEGFAYLNKIIEYEHTPYQPWMKNGIHLGGGKYEGEQTSISNFLVSWKDIMEGIPYLGYVFYHQKKSSVTSQSISDSIKYIISNGVTIITFFGHSSTNIYDVDLGPAYEYENFGKYPFIYANGCYGGNFAISGKSFGEEWIVQPNRGAIGYIGSSGPGYLQYLGWYGNEFYKVLFQDSIGASIGNQLVETIRRFWSGKKNDHQYFNHAAMNNLQCDPALRLYHPKGPDLVLYQKGIHFLPNNLNAQMDSIEIQITIYNEGLVIEDSFRLAITQFSYSTAQIYYHDTLRLPPFYTREKTISIKVPIISPQIAGLNTFTFYVDSDNEIKEINEVNNLLNIDLYIPSNVPAILYPSKFAVINKNQITLKASTYTPWEMSPVAYEFEIDTVLTFDSPFKKQSGIIQGTASLGEWQLPFVLQDSTVYYWRVRLVGSTGSDWEIASFQYIQGPYQGWAQGQKPQYLLETQYAQVNLNSTSLKWDFLSKSINIRAKSSTTLELYINNELAYDPWTSFGKDIYVTLIDKNSLNPKLGYNVDVRYVGFKFPEEKNQLTAFLLQVNPGDYVLIGGVNGINPVAIDDALWSALEQIGASNALKYASNEVNFVILGKKGSAPGSAIEAIQPSPQSASIETYLYTNYENGAIISPVFGPASQWNQLIWQWHAEGPSNGDQAYVSLYGYRNDGTKILLKDSLGKGIHDLSWIDATTYPRLQLICYVRDTVYRTMPQIDYWYLLGVAVPEATVSPTVHFIFQKDTLMEGEYASISLAISNVSEIDMDSILVKYEVVTAEGDIKGLGEQRYAPLEAYDIDTIRYTFSTDGLTKANTLLVTINPDYDQPEYSLHNNVFQHSFYVKWDYLNPLLDVTFDGKHILDGDIVSPTPEILIEVNDENPYYLIDDTSMITVYLKREEEFGPPARVFYSSNQLEFIPATDIDNRARVYFRPGPLEDGVYVLQVQGHDKKGNSAGIVPYSIRFRVINESAVSHVFNYPNPFSTSTRFVYTITGSVLPEVFQIHIYTVSGKLVKVIDLVELGEVRIGRNITDYAWDGTDEFGDRLANGVYLYRVVIKMPGNAPISAFKEGNTDQYFKSGWGKMYIMR